MVDLVYSKNSKYLRMMVLISFDQVNLWISLQLEEEGR